MSTPLPQTPPRPQKACTPRIPIPQDMLPKDGRFGCGPAKVPLAAVEELARHGTTLLGTSHRKPPVKDLVRRLREGLRTLYSLPGEYEIALANGGATTFWDTMVFSLLEGRSQHLCFGEFSHKFAKHVEGAPFLDAPLRIESEYGTHPLPIARDDIATYALTHNETSTGVMMPLRRPCFSDGRMAEGLVVVDATSAAGGINYDHTQVDAYYFSPQKCLASEGGIWLAILSPAAIERARRIDASNRWIPKSLRLATALDNSPLNQTYNTPSISTLFLAVAQVEWLNNHGGITFAEERCHTSAARLYNWAEVRSYTTPYVKDPAQRSPLVGTVDLDPSIDAKEVVALLAENGIVDTGAYGKLNRNQLRIAMFPAVDPADIEALLACIDYVVERLA